MNKQIIDNIIVISDETGKLVRMEKMVNSEELMKFIEVVRTTLLTHGRKIRAVSELFIRTFDEYTKKKNEVAAMVRFDFKETHMVYSYGNLDEEADKQSSLFYKNGFFVYEKIGAVYY